MRNYVGFSLLLLAAAPAANAQQWLVNNMIQNHSIEVSICDSAQKKGQRLPDICAKYPQFSGAKAKPGERIARLAHDARTPGATQRCRIGVTALHAAGRQSRVAGFRRWPRAQPGRT